MYERTRGVFFAGKEAEQTFDPLSESTLRLEGRLLQIAVTPDGRIPGARPLKRSNLPKNTATIIHEGKAVLIYAEPENLIVLGSAREGSELDKLIKRIS